MFLKPPVVHNISMQMHLLLTWNFQGPLSALYATNYQALQCHLSAADVLLRYPEIVQEERMILPSTPLRESDI